MAYSPLITHLTQHGIAVGKYLVSSLARHLADGGFGAGVSIRSGHGSATTDRVLRFTGRFDSEVAARRYGEAQGLLWVAHAGKGAH